MPAPVERSVRVSSLELFFDLVFVFTITQLTGVLVDGKDAAAVAQVVVMLLLIWWMYDGYAWLTNAISTDVFRFRLLLIGGMGGFLVIALAVPHAYESDGLAFGLGYLVVIVLHAAMFVRGASVSEARAILRIAVQRRGRRARDRRRRARRRLAGARVLGSAVCCSGSSPGSRRSRASSWRSPHFVERHGLVVIVALGESVVVIGAAAAGLPLDGGLVLVALLSLSLSAAPRWVYFSDEEDVERAFEAAAAEQRPELALRGFGYWHYGILPRHRGRRRRAEEGDRTSPYEPLAGWIALGLAVGTALFIASDVGFRRTFGIALNRVRLVGAAVVLATIPLGTELGAAAQVGAIAALVVAMLAVEWRARP